MSPIGLNLLIVISEINETDNEWFPVEHFPSHPSSFVILLPNDWREVEEIRAFPDNVYASDVQDMD